MLPGHPFTLNAAQFGVVVFVLAMTFLGGYFFGMTRAMRHGESSEGSKSIWTFDGED
jgi:hypothetical protein